ncbi:hypothetical protein [Phenylobacterium sp.]|jgi:hypothetical protein|uniref:hypothetical protein n=1 Tax=Phenylobacterium sp. TaxID=1871053 RepID=UPI002F40C60A
MRTALVTMIATAAVVSAAQAQTPATQATPPAAAAAPPASTPAPAAAAPAASAPAGPAATPAAPSEGATAAPTGEAAPTLPTTGDGAVLLGVVEKLCIPVVRGGKLDDLAKANGFKQNRRDGTWSMPLGGDRNYTVTMFPVGVNKDACRGEVHYALGQEKPIVSAFNVWSFLHQPELILQANYVNTDADGVKRVRKSWEHLDSTSSTAINFSTMTKPDDTPLNKNFATAEFVYQERHFQ